MSDGQSNVSGLIEAARRAEPDAVQRLLVAYRNYLSLLAQICFDRSLLGKADPSDVVQESLLKAQQRFEQFRGNTEPELVGWLRQILVNTVTDLGRRYGTASRQLGRERSLEQMLDASSQALDGILAASGTTPSRAAERREMGVVLADALAGLSDDHREVIVLRNLRELDWDDVAQKMSRSRDAVRVLWARALKELRPRIEKTQ